MKSSPEVSLLSLSPHPSLGLPNGHGMAATPLAIPGGKGEERGGGQKGHRKAEQVPFKELSRKSHLVTSALRSDHSCVPWSPLVAKEAGYAGVPRKIKVPIGSKWELKTGSNQCLRLHLLCGAAEILSGCPRCCLPRSTEECCLLQILLSTCSTRERCSGPLCSWILYAGLRLHYY